MRINTQENKVMSLINNSRDSSIFWEFNSTFHSTDLKDFKVFSVLRVWGKLFQSLAVLTAKVRPPSEMFLWRGDSRFKFQFFMILVWLSEFFLKNVFK